MLIGVALFIAEWVYFDARARDVENEQVRLEQEDKARVKIEKKLFGKSVKGKLIEGYVLGSGATTVLLLASVHGDEIGTTDLLNRFMQEVQARPNMISKAKQFVVLPIANPDGYYDRLDKLNANKVNLNLNFATRDWKEYGPEGTYAGPKPFSEPESVVIQNIVQEYRPSVMISYHARGALVSSENNAASVVFGKWYAATVGYEYFEDWEYPGTATKWFAETTGNAAVTPELTTYRGTDWEQHRKALLKLISSDSM